MIKPIERPEWPAFVYNETGSCCYDFHHWFKNNIVPINKALESAVVGYGDCSIYTDPRDPDCIEYIDENHKFLVINIEPIKQETCADVLKDWIMCREFRHSEWNNKEWSDAEKKILERAKAALERES